MRIMKQLFFILLFLSTSIAFAQQPAGRPWDDDVKKLIDEAVNTSNKFRDAFKKVASITTKDGVQVDVKKYMSDYDETFKRFKDSFDSKGAADQDLVNVFRMTNEIDRVMTRNPDAAGAGSEWQAHKFNVERMAQAFHTSLSEETPVPKRMGDDQVKALMTQLKEGSKMLGKSVKDAMKKDTSFDKAAIKSTEQSMKLLEKSAETVGKLFNDKKPLSVEMQDFIKQMNTVKSFLTEHPLGGTVESQWDSLERNSNTLIDEFGMTS